MSHCRKRFTLAILGERLELAPRSSRCIDRHQRGQEEQLERDQVHHLVTGVHQPSRWVPAFGRLWRWKRQNLSRLCPRCTRYVITVIQPNKKLKIWNFLVSIMLLYITSVVPNHCSRDHLFSESSLEVHNPLLYKWSLTLDMRGFPWTPWEVGIPEALSRCWQDNWEYSECPKTDVQKPCSVRFSDTFFIALMSH